MKVTDIITDIRMSRLRQSLLQGLQTLTGWIQYLRDGYSGIKRGLLQIGKRHVMARKKERPLKPCQFRSSFVARMVSGRSNGWNTARSDSFFQLGFAPSKKFEIRETTSLQFRAEV